MPSLTIKNMPDNIYEQLKKSARLHHRSLNSEILYCIERTIVTHKVDVPGTLEIARKLRAKTAEHVLTDDELNNAKNEGRP